MDNLGITIWFAFALLSAIVCVKLAAKNNLSTFVAAFFGFFAPILSLVVYAYINSDLYKRVHGAPGRSASLKKWSYVLGGVFLIAVGLSGLNDGASVIDVIWYIAIVIGGGYLISLGFKKNETHPTEKVSSSTGTTA